MDEEMPRVNVQPLYKDISSKYVVMDTFFVMWGAEQTNIPNPLFSMLREGGRVI